GARYPLLVEGEDIAAAIGREQEVAVLDAFGNALAGHGAADVVERDEVFEIAVRDFRVDSHEARSHESDQAVSALGSLKCTLSSMTASSSMVTAKRSRQAAMTSCTSTSGAEAPAVMPTRRTPSNQRQSISAALRTSHALSQPALLATSTRRTELEE